MKLRQAWIVSFEAYSVKYQHVLHSWEELEQHMDLVMRDYGPVAKDVTVTPIAAAQSLVVCNMQQFKNMAEDGYLSIAQHQLEDTPKR